MGNSRTRSINYKPKLTQWEAMEQLPLEIKAMIWDSAISWDAYAILRFFRQETKMLNSETRAIRAVRVWLDGANKKEHARPWFRVVGKKSEPSPSTICNVEPLRSYAHMYEG